MGDVLDSPAAGGVAIRGSLIRSGGFAAGLVLALVTAPILTRHLGVEGFGRYSAVLSLIAVVAALTEAGLGALAVRELSTLHADARGRLMRDLMGVRVVATLIGIAAAIAFAALVGYEPSLVIGTVLAGAGLMAYAVQGMLALPLVVDLRFARVTGVDLLRQLIYLLVVVGLVLAGAGVAPLLGATIPGGIVGLLVTMWMVRGDVPWRPSFDLGRWRAIIAQTLPIAAAGAISTVYFRLVILLMSVLVTATQTGYFALSFRIIEVAAGVPAILIGALFPILSRAADRDLARLTYASNRMLEMAVIAGAGAALLVGLGAPLGIAFLTGDPGGAAVDVLRIQAVALLPTFVNVAYGTCLIALRMHRELLFVTGGGLALMAVIAPPLVLAWGAKGGALATVLAETGLLVMCVLALRRAQVEVKPAAAVVAKVAAAAGAAGAAAVLVDVPTVPNVGAVGIAGVVYASGLAVLRAIPAELVPALLGRR